MNDAIVGKVKLFACGGAGINIGLRLEQYRGKNVATDPFAEIEVVYIDTSRSNMDGVIDPKHSYILENLDGSGKVRSETTKKSPNALKQFFSNSNQAILILCCLLLLAVLVL